MGDVLRADPAAVLLVESVGSRLLGCCVRLDGQTLDLVAGRRTQPAAVSALLARARASWGSTVLTVWTDQHDAASQASLLAAGATVRYVDLQMQRATLPGPRRALPPSTRLLTLEAADDLGTLQATHQLSCRAWGITSWWEAFLDRFVRVDAFDPDYFVLLARSDAAQRLIAAAIGERVR